MGKNTLEGGRTLRFERRTRWGEHVVGGGHFGENNFERETRGRTLVGASFERREH